MGHYESGRDLAYEPCISAGKQVARLACFTHLAYIIGGKRGPMDAPEAVPASEFTRNFGRYRMRAQRVAVAVSSHGQITGYFVGPEEYEEFRRFRESRRSFATAELPDEKVEAIRNSRMDQRHAHLNAMLDPK
jgi:hypothetical protein